jgi:hypothetical protein
MESKDPFHEFKSESAEPVSVGNHNLPDKPFACELQELAEPFAFEVDS